MLVESENQCGATVVFVATRFRDISKQFFRQKISVKRLIDRRPALQASCVSCFHAAPTDDVAFVADPDRFPRRHKETSLATEKLNQISVGDGLVSHDFIVHLPCIGGFLI